MARSEIHAYDNSAFNNGNNSHEMEERRADSKAEVERMGYEMYNGNKHENRWALRNPLHVYSVQLLFFTIWE